MLSMVLLYLNLLNKHAFPPFIMNFALRFPEFGSEVRLIATRENFLEEINFQLMSSFAAGSDSFILLNDDGFSLKDKSGQANCSEYIYGFSKESIKKEDHDMNIDFSVKASPQQSPLPGEVRGPLILEKRFHDLYKRSSEYLDFFNTYTLFSAQLDREMNIVTCANTALELYHNKHIQDQVDAFNSLYKKNLMHYEDAQEELLVFEQSVSKLSTFQIHPKLRTENTESVADLIDTVQLTKWKESYATEIERVQIKFSEIENIIKQLSSTYQLPQTNARILKFTKISDSVQAAVRFPLELYMDYRNLCEKFINNGDAQAGARLHEEKWEQKLAQANSSLSFVENNLTGYWLCIEEIKEQRKKANQELFTLLKIITKFASLIKNTVNSQLRMVSSLVKRSEKKLSFIRVPRLFPQAHDSTIAEVSRRNHFVRTATVLQDQLGSLIETEISERMDFLEKYRYVLPNNFVPQLSAAPFLRIVSSSDEPDFALPQIFDPLPESFRDRKKYIVEQKISQEQCTDLNQRLTEINDCYNKVKEENVILQTELSKWIRECQLSQGEYEKLKISMNGFQSDITELSKYKDMYFQNKITFGDREAYLVASNKELELRINLLKHELNELTTGLKLRESMLTQTNAEELKQIINQLKQELSYQCRTNDQQKITFENRELYLIENTKKLSIEKEFLNNKISELTDEINRRSFGEKHEKSDAVLQNALSREAKLQSEIEILRENSKKILSEIKNKDELILSAAKQLDQLYQEFKIKEKTFHEINIKLASEKAFNQELQKKKNELELELAGLCKELSITPSYESIRHYCYELRESNSAKISFTSFIEGSLVLFFPTAEGQFLAFNYNCSEHYLNLDSLNAQSLENLSSLPYIIGQITEKRAFIAVKGNSLCLPQGKEFYLLSIKEKSLS